jgi:hypothetical protein
MTAGAVPINGDFSSETVPVDAHEKLFFRE